MVGAAMNADFQRARFSAATLTSWPDICRTWRVNASHWGVGDGALNRGARPAGRAVLKRLVGATRNADTRPGARPRSVLAVATSASFNFDAWLAAWDPRNGGVYVYVVRLVGLCGGSRYWEVGLIARSCPLNVRGLARC